MKRGKVRTAKSPRRPRIESKESKLKTFTKQLVALLALQQAVVKNIQQEIDSEE
jgi:hypothetical protein